MRCHLFLLLVPLLLVSCAHTPKALPSARFSTPPAALPVLPAAEAVRADVAASGAMAARLEGQVAGLQRSTSSLREGLGKAVTEADRLRNQKAATEKELSSLWQMLKDSEAKVQALVAEVEAAWNTAAQQRELRVKAEANLAELTRTAAARDAEAASLRLQRQDMVSVIDDQAKENQRLTTKLAAMEGNAALGKSVKWLAALLVLAVVIWFALKILLRIYKPF